MDKIITSFVGLDVHKDSIADGDSAGGSRAAALCGHGGAAMGAVVQGTGAIGSSRESLQIVYEAGPCGYTLADSCAPTAMPAR